MKGSVKDIARLAFPVIAGSIAQTSISVADTAMLGRVGTVELAAIGMVSVFYLTFFMIGFSYTKGTQILVARRIGERDMPAVGRIFDNSLATILVMGTIIFLLLRFGSAPILHYIIKDPDIRAAGVEYLETRAWGIFFSFTGSVFLAFYMSIGSVTVLLVGVILMSLINIGLNYVFIFGMWGVPAMGITGAAVASNIAELIAASIFLANVFIEKLRRKYFMFRVKKLAWSVVRLVTTISTPIVAQTLIGLAGWMFFFYYIEKMGAEATAVSSIVKNIYMFFGLFTWGFSTASNTILSNLMGQKQPDEVVRALKNITIMSVITNAVLCLPLVLFARQLVEYLYSPEPAVVDACIPVIYVSVGALMIYSASMVMFQSIVSIGSVKMSLMVNSITVLIYILYIQIAFSFDNATVPFVWTCEIFYWSMLGLLSFYYIYTGKWRKIEI